MSQLRNIMNSNALSAVYDREQYQLQQAFFHLLRNLPDENFDEVLDFINQGASVNALYNQDTALSVIMRSGNYLLFSYFLNQLKANPEITLPDGKGKNYPLVWFALWEKRFDFFRTLLNRSPKNLRDENNQSLLMASCKMVSVDAVKICVQSGKVDLDLMDNEGKTALHHIFTVSKREMTDDHKTIIDYLVSSGADIELPDRYGDTPMQIFEKITENERLEMIQAEQRQAYGQRFQRKKRKKPSYGMDSYRPKMGK